MGNVVHCPNGARVSLLQSGLAISEYTVTDFARPDQLSIRAGKAEIEEGFVRTRAARVTEAGVDAVDVADGFACAAKDVGVCLDSVQEV